MDVLIDYDNIPPHHRRRGISNMVMSILEALPESLLPHGADIAIRLYGGWYESSRLSRVAQTLTGEIADYSPAIISLGTSGEHRFVRVFVELARSLLIDPSRIIPDTYRVKGTPRNLRPKEFPYEGCAHDAKCPLIGAYQLLQTGQCPAIECLVRVTDVIERHEQKLVDTMLTVDLIQATSSDITDIVVVTSDDDLWPGIRTAIFSGVCVHHIHTQKRQRTPVHYSANVDKNYRQYSF